MIDYDKIIANFRTEYSLRAETAKPGSIQRHTYQQIVQWIDNAVANAALDPQNNTTAQRGFLVLFQLDILAENASEPEQYQITRKCADNFKKETNIPW